MPPPRRPTPPDSSRTRTLLILLVSLLLVFLLISLSAHRNAPSSPSARTLAGWVSPSRLYSSSSLERQPSALGTSDSSSGLDKGGVADHDADPLSYRRFLEQSTSPTPEGVGFTTHSPTLGFDHIYVLSLPSRKDRRDDMNKLARALGIEITFVDAADKHEPFIQWIAEKVVESRDERRKVMAKARGVPSSRIGGHKTGSDWLVPYPGLTSSNPSTSPFPAYPPSPELRESPHWVDHLETLYSRHGGQHVHLRPEDPGLNVSEALWDDRESLATRQVSEGVISTYWGQTRAIKRVLENGDRTALILEDDVDLEWDIERLWEGVRRRLPKTTEGGEDWDVAFLGWCWGGEGQKPQFLHPLLHPSTAPKCLHAYALTSTGAKTLLDHMLSPWSAYSTAVDLWVASLVMFQGWLGTVYPTKEGAVKPLIRAWSLTPPLVVQRKDGPSDLQSGSGSRWRGVLRDSTLERVRRDEGRWSDEWEEEERSRVGTDPATKIR
ncbi:hypothetical protein JCM10207_005713, partial [Rhodosporidiobolus poonsookiae]